MWTRLGPALRLGSLVAVAGVLVMQSACQGGEEAHGRARGVDRTTRSLTSGDVDSVNGTYGAGCRDRSGAWSLAFTEGGVLDNPELSVVLNDVACELTLTGLRTTQGLLEATPPILLTTGYQATSSKFGSPVDFYANAKLSSVLFADDVVLTVLYSDDPNLATADNTAIAIPPTVVAVTPLDGAVDVSIATKPTATFSVPMDATTITDLTFTLQQGTTPVDAWVTYDAATRVATLAPWSALALDQLYEARVTIGARDTGDTPLAADFVWTFTTAVCSQGPVPLGSAATFAVLAASTATNTGATLLTGDLGVSPGTAVTGFPPGAITGTFHSADAAAAAAHADASTAYADAQGRWVCPIVVAGDVGGQILTPGLYRSSSSLAVSSADLTLDAAGEVDAVFVFQIASTLTVTSGRGVILANGARSANIIWQVGTSATLGTYSTFAGTILADQSITFGTGAVLEGRALAIGAAVTMDTNTIGEPTP